MKTRTETDSLGSKEIPSEARYGIHTARSLEHFHVAGEPLPRELIYGMVKLKRACAAAHAALGDLPAEKAEAIRAAGAEALEGRWDDQFPIDLYQAGSGTSSNMNVNEVLAGLASEKLGGARGDRRTVHPNDDVNRGQSTNNIFPSAIRMACVEGHRPVREALRGAAGALRERAGPYRHVVKAARTHLQDAVPITYGGVFGAWARALEKDGDQLCRAAEVLRELGVGGNAVGTGINTRPAFRGTVIEKLNADTGETYRPAEDGIERTQFMTDIAAFSGALRGAALDLQKIANDLRLLSSGPNTGLGELRLPAVEPGSSIMPGKINPSICEAVNMACFMVLGYDHALAAACGAGQLELNTHMPLIGACAIKMMQLIERSARMLTEWCLTGLEVNVEVCARHAERSAGLATVLNPELGYDRVAELVKESLASGKTLRELVAGKDILSEEALDRLLREAVSHQGEERDEG